jgi:hypothetical protein
VKAATPDRAIRCWHGLGVRKESSPLRLEGIAESGGVCISDDAHRQIRGKVDFAFDDMGYANAKEYRRADASLAYAA